MLRYFSAAVKEFWVLQTENSARGGTGHGELHTPARVQPLQWCWEWIKKQGGTSGEGCDRQNECQDLGWAQQTPLSVCVPEIAAGGRRSSRCPSALLHGFTAALLHPQLAAPPAHNAKRQPQHFQGMQGEKTGRKIRISAYLL